MHADDLDDHPRTRPGHQGKASIFAHTISRRAKHERISISNYLNNLTYRHQTILNTHTHAHIEETKDRAEIRSAGLLRHQVVKLVLGYQLVTVCIPSGDHFLQEGIVA